MQWITAHIQPKAAFGTLIKGDTLFGQLCWMLLYRHGEASLAAWLDGYADGHPFACISDAFPHGLVMRPELPPPSDLHATERKTDKQKRFLPVQSLTKPLLDAQRDAVAANEGWQPTLQAHNSIGRQTGATGNGADPFQAARHWPDKSLELDLHIVVATDRIAPDKVIGALKDIGDWGYGRDASIGLGRFEITKVSEHRPTGHDRSNAFMTLAPSAPQGGTWDESRCFYRPFVRFGRHGGEAAISKNPFKSPILLADTAAVLTPFAPATSQLEDVMFIGRGLGGNGQLSRQIAQTVHQGYAPVLPVQLGEIAP